MGFPNLSSCCDCWGGSGCGSSMGALVRLAALRTSLTPVFCDCLVGTSPGGSASSPSSCLHSFAHSPFWLYAATSRWGGCFYTPKTPQESRPELWSLHPVSPGCALRLCLLYSFPTQTALLRLFHPCETTDSVRPLSMICSLGSEGVGWGLHNTLLWACSPSPPSWWRQPGTVGWRLWGCTCLRRGCACLRGGWTSLRSYTWLWWLRWVDSSVNWFWSESHIRVSPTFPCATTAWSAMATPPQKRKTTNTCPPHLSGDKYAQRWDSRDLRFLITQYFEMKTLLIQKSFVENLCWGWAHHWPDVHAGIQGIYTFWLTSNLKWRPF